MLGLRSVMPEVLLHQRGREPRLRGGGVADGFPSPVPASD
jgi:hypothetical protein